MITNRHHILNGVQVHQSTTRLVEQQIGLTGVGYLQQTKFRPVRKDSYSTGHEVVVNDGVGVAA